VNWLDFVIILVMVWFAFTGLATGLIREVVMTVACILGVLLAGRLYLRLADDIRIVHDDPTFDRLVAFIVIFAAVFLAGQIAGAYLRQAARLLLLGPLDRLGGLAFGVVEGFLLIETLLIAFAVFQVAGWMTSAIDQSLLAPVFLNGAPWLLHLLPDAFREGVRAF
jgi:membrane protein required for colicin V production